MPALASNVPIKTISAATLAVPIRFALAQRIPRDEIEETVGLPIKKILSGNERVHSSSGPQILNRLVAENKQRAPSLALGEVSPFSLFNGLERLALMAPSGEKALHLFETYFKVFHSAMTVETEQSRTHFSFSFGALDDELDHGSCNEIALLVFIRLMRGVFGRHGAPIEVFTGYDPKGALSEYRSAFGSEVHFNTDRRRFGAVFKRADLEWANPGHDAFLLSQAEAKIKATLAASNVRSQPTALDVLKAAATQCAETQRFSVEDIARQAGMSIRSAQRVAKQHDTSLMKLLDAERLGLLIATVKDDPGLSAYDLAVSVGLSDERSLRRSLMRMNNMSIRDLRRSALQTG